MVNFQINYHLNYATDAENTAGELKRPTCIEDSLSLMMGRSYGLRGTKYEHSARKLNIYP
jgi:hypothetical protein